MKHVDYFTQFMQDTVNLSVSKLETLSSRVDTVYSVLRQDAALGPRVKGMIPQGSWAQKTIISPQNGKPFDGDFMVELVEEPGWAEDLNEYIDAVYDVLHSTAPYKDMRHGRKCRCVFLNYADNAMHLDIVPYVRRVDGTQWIVNRDDNKWERTDTYGFTRWMKDKDKIADGNLRKVIRLIKYLRDHKNSFTGTKSVLLTTLLGGRVDQTRKLIESGYYADLPTALVHIVGDLDVWLQARPVKPNIVDPAGTGTSFDHRWSQETYAYFRDRIHVHAAEMRDAYEESDRDESARKWQGLFGEAFKAPQPKNSLGKYSSVTSVAAAGSATVNLSGRAG